MASALPPIPPNISHVTAPLLFGALFNWCLFGVLVVQLYVYSYNFPEDNKVFKLLVFGICFLEALQTALTGADLYYWFISGYGDMLRLASPYASPFDVPIIESVVSLCVQFFFSYRIWVLSMKQTWWFSLVICLFSVVAAAAAFTGGIYAHIHGRFASTSAVRSIAMTWLTGNMIADILIAAAMLFYLQRRRERDCYNGDHVLRRVVRLTIETNMMTATVGTVSLILIAAFPHEIFYTCPTAILGKLYSNTLLVSLNNRISTREAAAATGSRIRSPPDPATLHFSPRSEGSVETMVMQPPVVHKVAPLEENKGYTTVAIRQ